MKKLLIIFICSFLFILVIPSSNATTFFKFDYLNLTEGMGEIRKWNLSRSSVLFDFATNATTLGYKGWICKYDNEATLPPEWTTSGTVTIVTSNLEENQVSVVTNGGHGDLQCDPTTTQNLTAWWFWVNHGTSGEKTFYMLDGADSNQALLLGMNTDVGASVLQYRDPGWLSGDIRYGKTDETEYVFGYANANENVGILNNMSKGGYWYRKWVSEIRNITTFSDRADWSSGGQLVDYIRVANSTAEYNITENIAVSTPQVLLTAQSSYDVFIMGDNTPEKLLDIKFGISCNNGTNWVNGTSSQGGFNLSRITCFNTQVSHDLQLAVYNMNLSTNWTSVFVREKTVPDITPPSLLNDDSWCTSCSPVQKIDNQPWLTGDITPTMNATMNESATCAIVANLTTPGNYNYTDIINDYGGVECTTTGGANQICTVQASNAIDGNGYLCVGCKDGRGNEFLNATLCANIIISLNLTITDPTTASPASKNPSEKLTVRFNLTGGNNVLLTSGVIQENVTIGGDICVPSTNTLCSGTPIDCGDYPTEAACNTNGTSCSWDFTAYFNTEFETFETDLGNWIATDGDAGCDFLRDQDGTPSSSTGPQPQNSAPGANSTDYYMFVEASTGQCDNGEQAYLRLNGHVDLDTYPTSQLDFSYSMYGSAMGTLNVQLNTSGTWSTIWTIAGDQGSSPVWTGKNVPLDAYEGALSVRFEYDRTASGFQGDIALDHINISQLGVAACSGTANDCSNANYVNESSCTGAGCDYGLVNEFTFNTPLEIWEINCTVPAGCLGLEDLFVNATYSGKTVNETQPNAVNCGVVDTCNPDSPLSSDHDFDCDDNCEETGTLDCNSNSITTSNKGSGSIIFEQNPVNCAGVTLGCNYVTQTS